MSAHKRELGQDYTESQSDYVAGRLDFQKQQALDAKKVRSFLIANPGSNTADIKAGTGLEKVNDSLNWLAKRGLVRNGITGYVVVPIQDLS